MMHPSQVRNKPETFSKLDRQDERVPAQGYLVNFAFAPAYNFFAVKERSSPWSPWEWNVREVRTGMLVTIGCKSRYQAIDIAMRRVAQLYPRLDQLIEEGLKITGS